MTFSGFFFMLWHHIEGPPLIIPFADGVLKPSYGWAFHLVMATGATCVLVGAAFLAIPYFLPEMVEELFGKQPYKEEAIPKNKEVFHLADPPKDWLAGEENIPLHNDFPMDTFYFETLDETGPQQVKHRTRHTRPSTKSRVQRVRQKIAGIRRQNSAL